MLHYRLYCIDSRGHFFRCEEFAADGDEEAISLSAELRGRHAAELWSGKRIVKAFDQPGAGV
jgi:hypothetical protein